MAQTDIFITELEGSKRTIQIPWLPDKIDFKPNGTRFVSYDIMDFGEVIRQNGDNIGEFSWTSKLPGAGHQDLPFLRGEWMEPIRYQTIFSEWRIYGTPLRLIITGTPVNHDVLLSDYPITYTGAFGDYEYTISFRYNRKTTIISVENTTNESSQRSETVTSEKTHTVVKGDTLWGIAVKYLGNGIKWQSIYDLNKAVIEETAQKNRGKSSDNGHWIYPGTVLKIPS